MAGRRRAWWGAALLLLAPLPAAGDGDPAPPVAGDGAQRAPAGGKAPSQQRIDEAVARGVRYLLAEQKDDGGFGTTAGETGLALWALRHSGLPRDDRAVRRAAARLERDLPDGTTYGTSLGVCGLLAHDLAAHRERIRKCVDALVRGQCQNGQWSYLAKQGGRRVGDNSNTQCAALALGAAKIRGLDVPAETLQRLLVFTTRTQNPDGGWGYSENQTSGSYGAMTAGMYMAWGLGSAALAGLDPRTMPLRDEPESKAAMGWLGREFVPGTNPRNGEFTIYWLWSVERAGVLLAFDRVGTHDWYAEGARWLLDRQGGRGSWTDERTVADTCWALLFLRRGTTAVVTPDDTLRGPVTPSGNDGSPPEPGK